MTALATGVDIVELARFQEAVERHGDRFLRRIFTDEELDQAGPNPSSLAARFAAKEAVVKALCTGIGPVTWHEVQILRGPAREPVLRLSGEAERLAQAQGLKTWSLSLSHSVTTALAFVVALGD